MKRFFPLFACLLFIAGQTVFAEKRNLKFPSRLKLSPAQAHIINKRLQSLEKQVLAGGISGLPKATTNHQNLVGAAEYNYTNAPGSQYVDSFILKYTIPNTSYFDPFYLYYDYQNSTDLPNIFSYQTAHIDFDTVWATDPPGSGNRVLAVARSYKDGSVSKQEMPLYQLNKYKYNLDYQLSQVDISAYNTSTSAWEDAVRFFLVYDGHPMGNLVRDSAEIWDGSSWLPYYTFTFTYDNTDRLPDHEGWIFYDENGVATPFMNVDILYNAFSSFPRRVVFQMYNDVTMAMENYILDTMGFSNNVVNRYDSYDWNANTNAWVPYSMERRRLNADLLPDSTWAYYWSNGAISDTIRYALGYNEKKNPAWEKIYSGRKTSPDREFHWYYDWRYGTGLSPVSAQPLDFYPNPVQNVLYLKNVSEGAYIIKNALGQVVQAGEYEKNSPISVGNLSGGLYLFQIETSSGTLFSGNVLKE